MLDKKPHQIYLDNEHKIPASPVTKSKYVDMGNGVSLENYLNNDIIEGQIVSLDNTDIDISETAVNGTADIKIEGRTYHNILQNPSSQPLEHCKPSFKLNEGQTAPEGYTVNAVEGPFEDLKLYGNTIKNETHSPSSIDMTTSLTSFDTNQSSYGDKVTLSDDIDKLILKGNTLVNSIGKPINSPIASTNEITSKNDKKVSEINTVNGPMDYNVIEGKTLKNLMSKPVSINNTTRSSAKLEKNITGEFDNLHANGLTLVNLSESKDEKLVNFTRRYQVHPIYNDLLDSEENLLDGELIYMSMEVKIHEINIETPIFRCLTSRGQGGYAAEVKSFDEIKKFPINEWVKVSAIRRVVRDQSARGYSLTFGIQYEHPTTNGDQVASASFRNGMWVNLTRAYGAGNEPTQEEFDKIPYFYGMKSVSSPSVLLRSNNLYTTKNGIAGYYVAPNGTLSSAKTDFLSDFIECKPNTSYAFKVMDSRATKPYGSFAFYDKNKTFISTRDYTSATDVCQVTPNNTYYMRVWHSALIECGNVPPNCMLIETTDKPSTIIEYTPKRVKTIQNGNLTPIGNEPNVYYDHLTGERLTDEINITTLEYSVKDMEYLTIENGYGNYTFWDIDGSFILGVSSLNTDLVEYGSIKVPQNAETIKFAVKDDKLNIVSVKEVVLLRSTTDNVKDTLNFKTGELVKLIDEVTLNGTETWTLVSVEKQNTVTFKCSDYASKMVSNGSLTCDRFFNGDTQINDYERIELDSTASIIIRIAKFKLSGTITSDGFKRYLTTNPTKVQYVLKQPKSRIVLLDNMNTTYVTGFIELSSITFNPELTYGVYDYSRYIIPSLKSNTKYTLKNVNSFTCDGVTYNGNETFMSPTSIVSSEITLSKPSSNAVMIEGEYTDIPNFKGLTSISYETTTESYHSSPIAKIQTTNTSESEDYPYMQHIIAIEDSLNISSLSDTVKDTLDMNTGILVKNIEKEVFNGNESWTMIGYTSDNNCCKFSISTEKINSGRLADGFNTNSNFHTYSKYYDVNSNEEGIFINTDKASLVLVISKNKLVHYSVIGLKEYLRENPLYVEWKLKDSVDRRLSFIHLSNWTKEIITDVTRVYENSSYEYKDYYCFYKEMTDISQYVYSPQIRTVLNLSEFQSTDSREAISIDGNNLYIKISADKLADKTKESMDQYLSENPIELYYMKEDETVSVSNLDKPMSFNEGYITSNSKTIAPTTKYSLPTYNYFKLTNLKPNTDYTLYNVSQCNINGIAYSNPNSITIGDTVDNVYAIINESNNNSTSPMMLEGTFDYTPKYIDGYKSVSYKSGDVILRTLKGLNLIDRELFVTKAKARGATTYNDSLTVTKDVLRKVTLFDNVTNATPFKKGVSYTFAASVRYLKYDEDNKLFTWVKYTDGTFSYGLGVNNTNTSWARIHVTSERGKTVENIGFSYEGIPTTQYVIEVSTIHLYETSKGDYKNDTSPYIENTITAPSNFTLRSFSDSVYDELNLKTGLLIRRTGEEIIDGKKTIVELETPVYENIVCNFKEYNKLYDVTRLCLGNGVHPKLDYSVVSKNLYTMNVESNSEYTFVTNSNTVEIDGVQYTNDSSTNTPTINMSYSNNDYIGGTAYKDAVEDGYVDNMIIGGETLLNVAQPSLKKWTMNKTSDTASLKATEDEFIVDWSKGVPYNAWIQANGYSAAEDRPIWGDMIYPNTTYTLIFEILENNPTFQGQPYTDEKAFAWVQIWGVEGYATKRYQIPIGKTGIIKTTIKFDSKHSDVTKRNKNIFGIGAAGTTPIGEKFIDGGKLRISKNIMLIQGDHTDKDIPYFEGLSYVESPKVQITGKNLLNWSIDNVYNGKDTYNYKEYIPILNEDKSITIKSSFANPYWLKQGFYMEKGKKYTITITGKKSRSDYNAIVFGGDDLRYDGSTYMSYSYDSRLTVDKYNTVKITSIALKTGYVTRFFIHGSTPWLTYDILKFQVEEGDKGTEYEPYRSNTISANGEIITLNTNTLEQGSIDDYNNHIGNAYDYLKEHQSDTNETKRLRTKELIPVKPDTVLTLKTKNNIFKYSIFGFNEDKLSTDTLNTDYISEGTIEIPSDVHFISICVKNYSDSKIIPNDYLNVNDTIVKPLDETLKLYSLPNGVRDTLDLVTGEYVQRVGRVEITEEFSSKIVGGGFLNLGRIFTGELSSKGSIGTNVININSNTMLKTTWADNTIYSGKTFKRYYNGSAFRGHWDKRESATTEQWRDWFKKNKTIILVELETPITKLLELSKVSINTPISKNNPYVYKCGSINITSKNSILPKLTYELPHYFSTNFTPQSSQVGIFSNKDITVAKGSFEHLPMSYGMESVSNMSIFDSVNLSLGSHKLMRINNEFKDELDFKNKRLIKHVGEIDVNTNNFQVISIMENDSTCTAILELRTEDNIKRNTPTVNSKFNSTSFSLEHESLVLDDNIKLTIFKYRLKSLDVDGVNDYLAHNSVKLVYALNTPEIIPFEDIPELSNNMPIAYNNGRITLFSDTDVIPSVYYRYPTDNSYYVENLQLGNQECTIKSKDNAVEFYIDVTKYTVENNTVINTPELDNNPFIIFKTKPNDSMILLGDLTNTKLPYFTGVRSSFDENEPVSITTYGKNMFNLSRMSELEFTTNTSAKPTDINKSKVVIDLSSNTITTSTNNALGYKMSIEPDKKYIVHFDVECEVGTTGYFNISTRDMSDNVGQRGSSVTKGHHYRVFTSNTNEVALSVSLLKGTSITFKNIMVISFNDDYSTPIYEPYEEYKVVVKDLINPLLSLPDGTCDIMNISADRKRIEVLRNCKKVLVDNNYYEVCKLESPTIETYKIDRLTQLISGGHMLLNTVIPPKTTITYAENQAAQQDQVINTISSHNTQLSDIYELIDELLDATTEMLLNKFIYESMF